MERKERIEHFIEEVRAFFNERLAKVVFVELTDGSIVRRNHIEEDVWAIANRIPPEFHNTEFDLGAKH